MTASLTDSTMNNLSSSERHQSALGDIELNQIASGECYCCFEVLGLHPNPNGEGFVCRVFIPWAEQVVLLDKATKDHIVTLNRVHEDGIFEATLQHCTAKFNYLWLVNDQNGVVELEDPYRFESALNPESLYLFNEGSEERAFEWLGANHMVCNEVPGVLFAVWAPNATRVAVVGDFNQWDHRVHAMRTPGPSGVWEIFIPHIEAGVNYKFQITDAHGKVLPWKADPYAKSMQPAPETASRVTSPSCYDWNDAGWMERRSQNNAYQQPVSIYEVHLGSWRRVVEEDNRYLTYREFADQLTTYVKTLGFTHIQLMPISEYPFDGSWGYQPIGLFSPTARFGEADDLKYFIDQCHQNNIGVILDWVPGHFPNDAHGLTEFDGSCLYEHDSYLRRLHPDWNTSEFNYGRHEVVSFLLSNAQYWLQEFHFDGLRVDAVASMLYLDYSREEGQWEPNDEGGREHKQAIAFLKTLNTRMYQNHPGILMIAEESTAWPAVTGMADQGGLGFGFKWNMGWMNDTLQFMSRDPIYRHYHQDEFTFGIYYAWSENFILPLSHDEVVHGKGTLINKMPGDDWQKFANLRAYFSLMWGHPGKKLLFMGGEFAQWAEWNHDRSLDWHHLNEAQHAGVQELIKQLNQVYVATPALFKWDCDRQGFQWLQINWKGESVYAWARIADDAQPVIVITNLTPQVHDNYRLGVPWPGCYREIFNSDRAEFGGTGAYENTDTLQSDPIQWDGHTHSICLALPPLSTVFLSLTPDP